VDEIPLHAGGLMANHAEAGDRVIVVAMHYPGHPPKLLYPEVSPQNLYGRFKTEENYIREVASKEIDAVVEALGIDKVITWDYAGHTEALFDSDAVDKVTATLNEYEPDIVVTHWPIGDYTDFIGAGTAVMRSIIERRLNKMPQVYFSETLTGKHTLCFAPNVYVDISRTLKKKKAACEKIWLGKNIDYFFNPFALPIAHFRGRECGVAYAEAYAALYGGFGIEKKSIIGPAPGARPVSMRRSVELLDRKPFAKDIYPTYGEIDDETARKAFTLNPEKRLAEPQ